MKKFLLLALSSFVLAAFYIHKNQGVLQGAATDENGEALLFANIKVFQKDSCVYTGLTDVDGKYQVQLAPGVYAAECSYVGYETRRVENISIAANKNTRVDFQMQTATQLEEVVIMSRHPAKMAKENAQMATPYPASPAQYPDATQDMIIQDGRKYRVEIEFESETYEEKVRLVPVNDSLYPDMSREQYAYIAENPFLEASANPVSTFSIDVDGAAYSNCRRFLNAGQMPPPDAVRLEEFINYFDYQYEGPKDGRPFAVHTELVQCPWNPDNRLLMIGLQGRQIETGQLPPSNFVFLIDVSGSMDAPDKLGLVQQSLAMLTDQLRPEDRVALVVYAGAAGLVLPSTPGSEKQKIKDAILRLSAGGSTAGAAGIQLAYQTARKHFISGGNNRVVLCTDGDFNVGASSDAELVRLIEKERESGVFLTVLGFGRGNYQDSKMQQLADKGNGNHAYIDQLAEAKKVLISEFGGTLFAIAKDVKLQLEFNPARVAGYRLIGYENRLLNRQDFDDDTKDAGELGAGHRVTALYEIVPAGKKLPVATSQHELKYQEVKPSRASDSKELLTLKLRYKAPKTGAASRLLETVVADKADKKYSENLKLAAAAASFGMLLRDSPYKGSATYESALSLAKDAARNDPSGYRTELCRLIQTASKHR